MSRKNELTHGEILQVIEAEEKAAYGYYLGELSDQRQEALEYYLGEGFDGDDDLPDGRSTAVSTDVCDTIEWVLPALLKIFLSGDDVVAFDPAGPEDVEAAEQETAYINHLVTEKNDAASAFHAWFKDSLISKVGYIKCWYEEKEDVTKETYEGLVDEEFAMLLQDSDVEPIAHTERTEMIQGGATIALHDLTLRRIKKTGDIRLCPVPPEEMFVSTRHRSVSLKEAPFVEQRRQVTVSELREMGYDVPDDIADHIDDTTEEHNRDQYGEWKDENEGADPASRLVWVREIYIRIDQDKDGIAELKKYVLVGKTFLEEADADLIPFAALCPVPMPHRHVGLSYADLIMDLQQIKSMLLRGVLDNVYLANNGRYAISDRVNLSDMLVSRPGGVVRVDGEPGNAILPLVHPTLGDSGLRMLEYADSIREGRTGVTRYNQGMDANSLNKTATGIQQIMSAAQERVALVARMFAEGGVKDLFLIVHALVLKHEKAQKIFRLRNKWVPIDPRQWVKRTDMSISVGLGTGSKDAQLGHLANMFQMAMNAYPAGVVRPVNVYNMLRRVATNAGFKNPDEFFTNPDMNPPPAAPPDPRMMEAQAKLQLEQQKAQADLQQEQLRSQNDVAIERDKIASQMELERAKLEFEREKAILNANVQIEIARMKAELDAQIKARENYANTITEMTRANQEHEIALKGVVEKAQTARGDDSVKAVIEGMKEIMAVMSRPKTVIRGPDGRMEGVA